LRNERMEKFGCSDCNCNSHLYYFPNDPVPLVGRIRLRDRKGRELKRQFIKINAVSSL